MRKCDQQQADAQLGSLERARHAVGFRGARRLLLAASLCVSLMGAGCSSTNVANFEVESDDAPPPGWTSTKPNSVPPNPISPTQPERPSSGPQRSPQSIEFGTDITNGLSRSRDTGRPVVVVFGAVWCPACRTFRKKTLPDPSVQSYGDQFEWVYVDIDRSASVARSYQVTATPQFIVLDSDGVRLGNLLGDPGAEGFGRFLEASRGLMGEGPGPDGLQEQMILDGPAVTDLTFSPDGFRGQSICFSHVGYGPLNVPSQSPTSVLRLAMEPRTPSTLARGQFELQWTETLTNFWGYKEDELRLDYGALFSTLSLGYGVSDTVQVELQFIDFRRFNSVLDDLTNAFHDLFGLGDAGRDLFPEEENVIFINTPAGQVLSENEDTYTQDLAFTFQHNITCGTRTLPAIAYSITARSNTGGNVQLEGDKNLSIGASVSASRRFGQRWYAYASFGNAWHGQNQWRGIELNDSQYSFLIAGEYRYGARSSWVLQYLVTEAVSETIDPFNQSTHEIDLGWKRELKSGTVIELGLVENLIEFDNSPDVGLHFGLTHRF